MRGLLLAAAVIAAPAPAAAKAVEGGPVGQRTVTIAMAQCAVHRDHVAAERFVLADVPDADGTLPPELKAARQRIIADMVPCLGHSFGSATMRNVPLRGFLAEALLKQDGASRLAAARALPAVAPAPVAPGPMLGVAFWRCVVAATPQSSADLLAALDGSSEEARLFDALSPALQRCAPSDRGVRIEPGNIRPQVAAALYRRVAGAPATE